MWLSIPFKQLERNRKQTSECVSIIVRLSNVALFFMWSDVPFFETNVQGVRTRNCEFTINWSVEWRRSMRSRVNVLSRHDD